MNQFYRCENTSKIIPYAEAFVDMIYNIQQRILFIDNLEYLMKTRNPEFHEIIRMIGLEEFSKLPNRQNTSFLQFSYREARPKLL